MLKNKKHDHLGMATNNLDKLVAWYVDELGFEVFGECVAPDGTPIKFIRNGDLKYEIFQPAGGADPDTIGRIDHVSYASDDIEKDYKYCVEKGYEILTDGIEGIDSAWEKGCRYFKIKGPDGEAIEFDQIL